MNWGGGLMIEIPPVELASINELKLDGENPNVMTKEQFDALKENIRRFGFLVPVITNEDGLVADGEHRLKAARDLGLSQVPVIRLPIKDVDRRIIRQVMNKLRGSHDYYRDINDFKHIFEVEEETLKKLFGDIDYNIYQDVEKVLDPEKELNKIIEFKQDDLNPVTRLIINFRSVEDKIKFGELLKTRITASTRSIWYPLEERIKARDYAIILNTKEIKDKDEKK